ncbi:MAG: aspartate aminotransferase family protein [Desulfatiglandaceae bacterium]
MNAEHLKKKYLEKTSKSAGLAKKACSYMPGGDTHGPSYHPPYHITFDRGKGCYIYDVDGNKYLDFCNQWLTMVHGHAFPPMVEAVQKRIARSVGFGYPTEEQYEFAQLLCRRVPCFEQMRFVASGSEATLMCIRAARAFTGKRKIMKLEGGYHGTHDLGEFNWFPSPEAGPLGKIKATAPDAGINGSEIEDVIIFAYNETEIFKKIISRHAGDVAAVIMEPMIGPLGMIKPEPGFLETIRSLTEKHGIILIFDEVVQFPNAYYGTQGLFGITPDLTALGKGIGGGLPIGAWGGRRDIMDLWNPEKGHDAILQVSTHAGNAVSMAAGLATMKHLTATVIKQRDTRFKKLQSGFQKVFVDAKVKAQVTGIGYGFAIHLTDKPVRNPRDSFGAAMAAEEIAGLIFMGLRYHGVSIYPPLFGSLSTAARDKDIDFAVDALAKTLKEIHPVIEEKSPHLLA